MATTIADFRYPWRLAGAVVLDAGAYEEIEAAPSARPQAIATVTMAGLAAGVGLGHGTGSLATIAFITVLVVLSWGVWAVLMFQIGARVLHRPETHADAGELIRTLGFATAPGWFLALAAAPAFTAPVVVVVLVWLLAAMTVAVLQTLDFDSTRRAALVCAMGWGVVLAIALVLGIAFGPVLSTPLTGVTP